MRIILITPSDSRESEVLMLTRMMEMGVKHVHIRKPKMSTADMRKYIAEIPAHFHDRLVLHSHHGLALSFPVKGIHITRLHKKRWFRMWWTRFLLKCKGREVIQTASYRKLASLYEERPGYDYVFLSPIFDSLSGTFQGGFNEFSLAAAIKKNGHKVIARGGITHERLERVRDIGFHGVALYSCIWKKKDPVKAMEEILVRFRELGIEADQ